MLVIHQSIEVAENTYVSKKIMRFLGNFKAAERPLAKFKNQNFGTIEFLVVEIMGKVTKNTNF